ncbi:MULTISPECIES: very short patch repair endonuclease [unclassified Ketobacter]|uniref:very short patch repair endonuclease n=1 Tax=unclassified Ketobacter TaxID=2639109 RepID=UPI000F110006|nr:MULTISPECIES: very short patch repair endonuclease [unclassified Ketobacter]RLT91262.1 MAG: DNA mismatch endonuclease Vsr [Ketobacter sp. GenoA1]RLT98303.1 MAG: DNA mismatch endonuclease Vsr [Ketobacter sp.]
MTDVLTKEQRSYCMSQIRAKNTKPEVILRKALWRMGWRYRINNKLPGKPDLIYPSLKVAIFIDGCFWHKCPKHYQAPKSRASFWEKKIQGNVTRDQRNNELLQSDGWLVVRVWEHEIKESLTDTVKYISEILSSCRSNSFQPTSS